MKENGENIYKMMNFWLNNCRSIFAFLRKEIKDTHTHTDREREGERDRKELIE